MTADAPRLRPLRSFVRREGRMTDGQKAALDRLLPRFGLPPDQPLDAERVFGRRAPLVFEIGFGTGDHLLARAQAEPERDFLGAEVHRPGVGRLLARAEASGLTNLRVFVADAVEVLRGVIPEGALEELVIQFPDPWHKKRHHKRRLIQPAFARLAASRLRVGGRLWLATDWADYAEHMLTVLNATPGLANANPEGGYVPRPASRILTRFEARGERLGHAVFDLCFIRV